MGAGPIILVPLRQPGRDHQHRSSLQMLVAHVHGTGDFARQEGDGRIEAQRLAEDIAQLPHLLEHRRGQRRITRHRADFRPHPILNMAAFGEHIKRPGHGAGRCFMAREEDGRHLLHHLVAGEGFPGVGMFRLNERLENVAMRRFPACMPALIARLHDRAEHVMDGARRAFRARFEPTGGDAVEPQHRRAMRQPLKLAEGGVDDVRSRRVQRLRKQRAKDDVGRDMRHHRIDIDRLAPVGRLKPRQQIVGRRHHQRHGPPQRGMGKGGIDHRPLAFPICAIGGKDAVAYQGIEIADQFAMLGECGAAAQDLVHQAQFIGDIHGPAGQADLAHLHRIAFVEQHMDPAMPAAQEPLDQPPLGAGRLRIRGRKKIGQGIVLKAATASSTVRGPAVRLMKSSGESRSPTRR